MLETDCEEKGTNDTRTQEGDTQKRKLKNDGDPDCKID